MTKKNYKAEPMDIIEALVETRFSPCIYFSAELSAPLNEHKLLKSIHHLSKEVPQIACTYDFKHHQFIMNDCNKCIIFNESPFNLPHIDFSTTNQLQIYLSSKSVIFCVSHMLTDGQGMKELISRIFDMYNNHEVSKSKTNERNLKAVIHNVDYQQSRNKKLSKVDYPIQISSDSGVKHYETIQVQWCDDDYVKLMRMAKQSSATINDMIMCSLARSVARIEEVNLVSIEYPYDLRKYMTLNTTELHIGNFVGDYVCNVELNRDETFFETLVKVGHMNKIQKESNINSLFDIRFLNQMANLLPTSLLVKGIKLSMKPPSLSMTNFGIIQSELYLEEVGLKNCVISSAFRPIDELQFCISAHVSSLTLLANVYATTEEIKLVGNILHQVDRELTELK